MIPVLPLVPIWGGPYGSATRPVVPNALPANAPLSALQAILRTDGEGQVIWGSLDSQTTNSSTWSFVRYQVSPEQNELASRGLIVDTEMGVLPEDNPNYEWFQGASFGQASLLVAPGPTTFLNLKSSVASPDLFYSFYYQRIEPFLGYRSVFDLDARYSLDYGTRGTGDARIAIQDTNRYVELATLQFAPPLGNRIRRIINNPSLSYAGLYTPTNDPSNAWTSDGFINATPFERVLTTSMSHPLGAGYFAGTLDPYIVPVTGTVSTPPQTGAVYIPTASLVGTNTRFLQELNVGDPIRTEDGRTFSLVAVADQESLTLAVRAATPVSGTIRTIPYADTGSRITESRFKVVSYPAIAGNVDTGLYVSAKANNILYTLSVQVVAGVASIRLLQNGPGSAPLLTTPFAWDDGAFHSYRIRADAAANNVTLSIDDNVVGGVALAAFAVVGATVKDLTFGHDNGSSTAAWETLSHIWDPPATAIRTLGVWLGGDRNDLNNWKVPRTDLAPVPNTDPTAAIYPMDWLSPIEVRIHRDPTFGVSVYRPDLIAAATFPPTWTGTPQFNSEYTDPTLAWINVEEPRIPQQEGEVFGSVAFGSIDPESICFQSWDYVRYRIYQWPDQDYRSPQHQVLNYANQIGSDELFSQTDTETVVVESLDNRTVSLIPTNIYARNIYRVIDGTNLISSSQWSFDPESQTIQLGYDANGFPVTFSSDHAAVTIVFVPGTPVTSTYLATVPFYKTSTLLNEGTPPYVYDQASEIDLFKVAVPVAISFASIANPVVINTSAAHGYAVGTMVQITSNSLVGLNGQWQVLSTPTATSFTVAYDNLTGGIGVGGSVAAYQTGFQGPQNLRSVIPGAIVTDPATGDFIDNTPYDTLDFFSPLPDPAPIPPPPPPPAPPPPWPPQAVYQDVNVYQQTNSGYGNLIAICDDSEAPEFALSGEFLTEYGAPIPQEPFWNQVALLPAGPTSTAGVLRASGGNYVAYQGSPIPPAPLGPWSPGGTLGPAAQFVLAPTKGQNVNQQVFIAINGVPVFP